MKTKSNFLRLIIASILSGFTMWVAGGLYHNLIMPTVNEQMHPHHEGLGITLIAYVILGLLMTYFYMNSSNKKDSLFKGLKMGVIIGILWVFPHGLTMAAVHESSISHEINNTLYHMVEQGIGGIMIYVAFRFMVKKKGAIQ